VTPSIFWQKVWKDVYYTTVHTDNPMYTKPPFLMHKILAKGVSYTLENTVFLAIMAGCKVWFFLVIAIAGRFSRLLVN